MLEKLCGEYRTHEAILSSEARAEASELMNKFVSEDENIPVGTFYERALRSQLAEFTECFFDLEEQRPGAYTIKKVESSFDFVFDDWKFVGIIDRIDSIEDGKDFLIDYKTGSSGVRMGATLREHANEQDAFSKRRDWQIPLYTWARYKERNAFPCVFSHYVTTKGRSDKPAISLVFILKDEDEWYAMSDSPLKMGKKPSYLLKSEIEECMKDACRVAEAIFKPREFFERTGYKKECFNCLYKLVCIRGASGTE
jgi:hypothetical protein